MEIALDQINLLMGSRENDLNEDQTFNTFVEKAKDLGFSKEEIERLEEYYSQILGRPTL